MESCHFPVIYVTIKERKHKLIHTGKLPFTYTLCDYKAKKKYMLIHTGKLPFACNLCDYKTKKIYPNTYWKATI